MASDPVQRLLETNIEGLGLQGIIEVSKNRTLAGAECDLLLVYKPNRLPFAALEIKKPPNTREEWNRLFLGEKVEGGKRVNRVAGEVWAEINGVRLFGFEKVYGMISTHNQFRLVCTHNINGESDNTEAMLKSLKELQKRNENFKGEQVDDESSNEIVTSPGKKSVKYNEMKGANRDKAKLFASQIIPNLDVSDENGTTVENSGEKIMQLVALFILKACTTLTKLLKDGGALKHINVYKSMACRIIKDNEKIFAFGTVALEGLNLDKFLCPLRTKTIYVIHHLGMGNSRNCCLGVSRTGNSSCVVKFYHQPKNDMTVQVAKGEYQNWKTIYGKSNYGPPMSKRFKIAEGHCLVMPYLKPVPNSDRHTLLESKIEKTLKKFAKSGYKHEDVKWRHFGYWGKEIFLLDLERVAKIETNEIDSWVTETLEKLRQKAGNAKTSKNGVKKRRQVNKESSPAESAKETPGVKKRRQGSPAESAKKKKRRR